MKITMTGDWKDAARILAGGGKRLQAAVDRAVLQEAQFFRTKVVEGIREQAPGGQPFKPLAPTTLAIRRFRGFKGTKALLVRGDLRNSIVVVRKPDGVFVGVLRTAKGREGQPLVNVAAVHEFGSRPIVVKLTPKARRFLHAAFRHLAGVRVPEVAVARPDIAHPRPRPIEAAEQAEHALGGDGVGEGDDVHGGRRLGGWAVSC